MAYANTFIYVLQFNYTFQYLFAWNNEVYRQEVVLLPGLLRRLAWRVDLVQSPYVQQQLEQGEQIILSGAMSSIDMLVKDKSGSQRRKAEKAHNKKILRGKCQWQARANNEGAPIYLCLTHNITTPFTKNPKH